MKIPAETKQKTDMKEKYEIELNKADLEIITMHWEMYRESPWPRATTPLELELMYAGKKYRADAARMNLQAQTAAETDQPAPSNAS